MHYSQLTSQGHITSRMDHSATHLLASSVSLPPKTSLATKASDYTVGLVESLLAMLCLPFPDQASPFLAAPHTSGVGPKPRYSLSLQLLCKLRCVEAISPWGRRRFILQLDFVDQAYALSWCRLSKFQASRDCKKQFRFKISLSRNLPRLGVFFTPTVKFS